MEHQKPIKYFKKWNNCWDIYRFIFVIYYRMEAQTDNKVINIPVDNHPRYLAYDPVNKRMYVTNSLTPTVTVIVLLQTHNRSRLMYKKILESERET